jgi:hypothetical protein
MRPHSLAFRLFASAAVWTLIVVPVAVVLLLSLYRHAVERNFDARLNVYLTSLIASTTADTIPFSGWYWQIKPLMPTVLPSFPIHSSISNLRCRAKAAFPPTRH